MDSSPQIRRKRMPDAMNITCDIYQLMRKLVAMQEEQAEIQKAQLGELQAIRKELEKLNNR